MKPSRSLLRDHASQTDESNPCSMPVSEEVHAVSWQAIHEQVTTLSNKLHHGKIGFLIVRAYVLEHQLPLGRCMAKMYRNGRRVYTRASTLDYAHGHACTREAYIPPSTETNTTANGSTERIKTYSLHDLLITASLAEL